jgi:hypothetical protein
MRDDVTIQDFLDQLPQMPVNELRVVIDAATAAMRVAVKAGADRRAGKAQAASAVQRLEGLRTTLLFLHENVEVGTAVKFNEIREHHRAHSGQELTFDRTALGEVWGSQDHKNYVHVTQGRHPTLFKVAEFPEEIVAKLSGIRGGADEESTDGTVHEGRTVADVGAIATPRSGSTRHAAATPNDRRLVGRR